MPGGVFSGIGDFEPNPLAIEFLFCCGTISSMMLTELLAPEVLRLSWLGLIPRVLPGLLPAEVDDSFAYEVDLPPFLFF